jgi:hypothetical protein
MHVWSGEGRLLVSILEHPCLAVKALGEWPLFQIVWDYIKEHKDLTSQVSAG